MSRYLSVNEFHEPVANARNLAELKTEMSESDLGFLCALIRERIPNKILEVGVASGGTTLVLLQCIKGLGIDTSLYSVDLNSELYSDSSKETGYVAKNLEKQGVFSNVQHEYCLGKYLPEVLEDIGNDIDFVILDTVHELPGELLDFLAVMPFLSEDAVIVLHDVSLQHAEQIQNHNCFATQVLFSCASGQKILNNSVRYPNIAAIQVDNTTRECVYDVFSALSLTWNYMPGQHEIDVYRDWYERHYDESAIKLFDQAFEMNQKTHDKPVDRDVVDYLKTTGDAVFAVYDCVYFYGAGRRGKALLKAIESLCDDAVAGKCRFVVTNREDAIKDGCDCWAEVNSSANTLFVLSAKSEEIKALLQKANVKWLAIPDAVWTEIERVYGG